MNFKSIAALLLCAGAIYGEETSPVGRKETLELIRLTTLTPESLDVLVPAAVDFAMSNASGVSLTAEEAAKAAKEELLSDRFLEKFAPAIEEIFSLEEIQALNAMYRSDVMKKFSLNYGKTCYPIFPSINVLAQEIVQKSCASSAPADSVRSITQESFKREVEESDLSVVLDLYSTYCPPCKRVAPIVAELSRELDGKVRFAKVNIDEHPSIAKELGVFSVPTFILFKNGEAVGRHAGFISKEELMGEIERAFESADSLE